MKNREFKIAFYTLMAIVATFTILLFIALCSQSAYAWGNQSWFDTTYSFENVQIALQDGSCVIGKCESWQDYENSDVVQVKVDGKVYLTHYMNVTLISDD